ncbi:MAG: L,D-transpeptidase [Paludibacteraceae bacterium]|nr:L,D-transpeptidase [Paludibacteraceae bacterium]
MKKKSLYILTGLLAVALAGVSVFSFFQYKTIEKAKYANFILISKKEMKLTLFDYSGHELFSAPCATGANLGDKKSKGDMKTPEGVFKVLDIQDSSDWTHDFGDGKGKIKGAYGPIFIRLDVPGFKGIGIHGTHLPESIGSRASEGCIRLKNEDVLRLSKLIYPPLVVVITPSVEDL